MQHINCCALSNETSLALFYLKGSMKLLIIFAGVLATVSAYKLNKTDVISTSTTVNYDERITNGAAAHKGQFPYQVRLLLSLRGRSMLWCGGSLIDQKWVLTAGHCANGAFKVHIYLGGTTTYNAEVTYTIYSKDIIIHHGYQHNNLRNDIALIKIPETHLSKQIQIIRLPSMSMSNETYLDKYAIASGWGYTSDVSPTAAYWLQWTRLKIINTSYCKNAYYNIDTNFKICLSTSGGSSTCNGDSGGPLVLESERIQIGVFSFLSLAGCELGHPVGFSRVTSYLNWIKHHTGIAYY